MVEEDGTPRAFRAALPSAKVLLLRIVPTDALGHRVELLDLLVGEEVWHTDYASALRNIERVQAWLREEPRCGERGSGREA